MWIRELGSELGQGPRELMTPGSASAPSASETRRGSDRVADGFASEFCDALRVGDGAAADAIVQQALAAGLTADAVQSLVIAPAMVRIGELWESRCIGVAEEHLATSISHRALIPLFEQLSAHRIRARSRERILLAGVQGQHHTLGLRMVADVLEGGGFDVLYLGGDVPADSLRSAVAQHRPAVVGLTYGLPVEIGYLAEALRDIHALSSEIRVILGGRAVPPALGRAYPLVNSTVGVIETVEELLAGPPQRAPTLVELLHSPTGEAPHVERPIETNTAAAGMAKATEHAIDVAREHIRRAEAYRDLAFRDPLTDLANRRAFDEELSSITQESSIAGALLMIDVDGFKSVNDEQGHQAGDRLLRAIANTIRGCIRPGDLAARFGGDEFAVLLPATTGSQARRIADRIRLAVVRDAELPVTVSLGVAALSGDPRGAVLAADTALYAAKAAGRNRTAAEPRQLQGKG